MNKKYQLIAKQFDQDIFCDWLKDNIAEIKQFLDLRHSILFWYFGDRGYDPAVGIYFDDKQKIREDIQTLRNYAKKVKEFEVLRRKLVQAFKDLNVPKKFEIKYNSSINQFVLSPLRADLYFESSYIYSTNRQLIKNKLAYAKFGIKVLSALIKIKGSKQRQQYEDDIVYEYDIYGNLIYKGMYDYSNWSQLEHEDAFLYVRNDPFIKPTYNEKLGVYLIGVSPSYRSNHKVQDERSLDYVYSDLDYLVGFAVVRNE